MDNNQDYSNPNSANTNNSNQGYANPNSSNTNNSNQGYANPNSANTNYSNQGYANPNNSGPMYGNPSYAGGYSGYNYSYNPNKKKMKTWKKVVIIVAIVLACVLFVVGCSSLLKMPDVGTTGFSSPYEPYLAQISVVGTIGPSASAFSSSNVEYHHKWTLDRIDDLIYDSYNEGLILFVDSPGGTIYESDELYQKIIEYKEETERPVYVYMGAMAASGGYYVSAPADKIFANRNTWTGSIGVIVGTLLDVSGFLENHGIVATDITSGPNKAMGSNFKPLTEEERAIFQSMVDEAYDQFVDVVAEGREMSVEEVKEVADGRILTAKQAVEAGLVDEIMSQDDFYYAVREEVGNEDIYIMDVVFYGQTSFFSSLIGILGFDNPAEYSGGAQSESEIDIAGGDASVAKILEMAKRDNKIPIKYMYE